MVERRGRVIFHSSKLSFHEMRTVSKVHGRVSSPASEFGEARSSLFEQLLALRFGSCVASCKARECAVKVVHRRTEQTRQVPLVRLDACEILERGVGLPSNVFIHILERSLNHRLHIFFIERLMNPRDMRESENRVTSNIEVLMV